MAECSPVRQCGVSFQNRVESVRTALQTLIYRLIVSSCRTHLFLECLSRHSRTGLHSIVLRTQCGIDIITQQ